MEQYKTCSKCKTNKKFEEFPKNPQNKKTGLHSQCKICRNAAYKEYALINHEKVFCKNARYIESNHLMILAKKRANYEANKEIIRKKNSESSKRNRITTRELTRRRRYKQKTVKTFVIKKSEFAKLYKNSCFYCGQTKEITLDHIIPISRGGNHGIGNLVSCCKSCNSSKGAKTIMEWKIKNAKISHSMR